MAIYKLGEVCKYTTNKISSNNLNVSNYISTENMISNARGVTKATSVPFNTQLTKYDIGNILFSNIRPYFRKVWLATKAGGCSNDVLCFSPTVKIKSSYAFYILSSQPFIDYVVSTSKGTKMPRGDRSAIMNYLINIPSIREQEKIIEIIKPIEYLFLKYPSLVRIDTVQNCKNDVGDLIEIIKPIENAEKNLNNQMSVLKEILANQYNSLTTERDYFYRYINIHNDGYSGQKKYFATNAIGEFEVDLNKIQDISLERPSRADLTPQPNSLIFSKLDGENKVLYIPEKFNYVVSTGFFNFTNEFMDHIVGFLLSDDYKKQKTMLSTGTTMVGLNIDGLRQIKLKRPTNNISVLTKHLTLLLQIMNALSARKEQIVSLLIR